MNNWGRGKQERYDAWISRVEMWANRHGISTKSAISILFDDSQYNPNGGADLVVSKDLYWAESNDFAARFLSEKNPHAMWVFTDHITKERWAAAIEKGEW